jgi:sugar phosphate isomerase/epimerase
MHLAFNSYVYEVADWPIRKTLESASRLGFHYIELAAFKACDPDLLTPFQKKETIQIFKDLGLYCSQILMIKTGRAGSPESLERQATLDYMKRCTDFQLELGGKQTLICRGCGVHLSDVMPEITWSNSVNTIREYAFWCQSQGILIDFEIEPHVYFVVNSTHKAAQMVEDVGQPNLFTNVDIGHLSITREAPGKLDKLRDRILQVHLSETDTYDHTNSILGLGVADFPAYVQHVIKLGIESNCARYDEPCVAGIELGSPTTRVDDPERWMRESLAYVHSVLPELTF